MREQHKSEWAKVKKRAWSTPVVRKLTPSEALAILRRKDHRPPAFEALAGGRDADSET